MGIVRDDKTPLYFKDDLFRFQTYMSGRYEIGPHEVGWTTNVQDMGPVWDDYRGDGVLVGVVGHVDNRHPELRENYKARYLDFHDPQDDIEGSSPLGTAMAGIIAADDDRRGLVGMAPDAQVFEFTGDRREKPDVVVLSAQTSPYGDDPDARFFRDEDARGGLGRVVIANTPDGDQTTLHYGLNADEDPLDGFDDPDGGRDASNLLSTVRENHGLLNSHYTYHSDRHVITAAGATMYGHKPFGSGLEGPMTLVSAPVGTSSYWGIHDPGSQWWDEDSPDYDPGYADWNVAGDAVQTLVLDHSGDNGHQQRGEGIGTFWELLADLTLDVEVKKSQNYTDAHGGGFASAVVGGAVALMLEANPSLGWRDVQAILAYSADPLRVGDIPYLSTWDDNDTDVFWQEESNWNGAGLMHSNEFGFGGLDTRAAVRLAETWGEWGEGARTSDNELAVVARLEPGQQRSFQAQYSLYPSEREVIDPFLLEFEVPEGVEIEHVALDIAFSGRPQNSYEDLAAMLGFQIVSPEGQRSIVAASDDTVPGTSGVQINELDHTFTSRAFWGQTAEEGETWRVVVLPGSALLRNGVGNSDVSQLEIESAKLRFYGAEEDRDDTYVYTDSLVSMMLTDANTADPDFEGHIADASGHGGTIRDGRGRDVINASAITYDLTLDAAPGGRGIARGGGLDESLRIYTLSRDTEMRGLIGGDGDDLLRGWRGHERLEGGRGRDQLQGKGGEDRLFGGDGKDRLYGNDDDDRLDGGAGNDRLYGGGHRDRLDGGSGSDRLWGGSGKDEFVFGRGDDRVRIEDFQNNTDTLLIDDRLVGRNRVGEVLDEARQKGADVVFDFGRGDVLIVEDATIRQLRDDIELF